VIGRHRQRPLVRDGAVGRPTPAAARTPAASPTLGASALRHRQRSCIALADIGQVLPVFCREERALPESDWLDDITTTVKGADARRQASAEAAAEARSSGIADSCL
jgi:hypothetical protein